MSSKLLPLILLAANPSGSDNLAAGYHIGQQWMNTVTGELFAHHTDGVWLTVSASPTPEVDYIDFNTSIVNPSYLQGRVFWDSIDKTLSFHTEINGTAIQIGQEHVLRIVNKTGSTITNGQVVYISGAQGNRPTAIPAQANSDIADRTIGVCTSDIVNNAEGYITIIGIVRSINTSAFAAGDPLYLSATTAGALTNVRPTSPNHCIRVGYALNSTVSGSIIVQIDAEDIGQHAHANHGVTSRAESTIAFNSGTRVFTIAPVGASFEVFHNGVEYQLTTKTVTLPNTTGFYFIYLDSVNALQYSTTPWDLLADTIPIATIFFYAPSASDYAMNDERHGAKRPLTWHKWAHLTVGTRYETGLSGTFTDTTLSLTQGTIHDEDIIFDTGGVKTSCRLWRYSAANATMYHTSSTKPYLEDATVLQYDNAGTPTAVSNGYYVVNDVYATTDPISPIYVRVGTAQYSSLALAQAALSSGTATWNSFSIQELKLLYRVIYRYQGGVITFQQASDYRSSASIPGGGSSPVAPHSSTHYAGGSDELVGQSINGLRIIDSPTFAGLTTTGVTVFESTVTQNAGRASLFYRLQAAGVTQGLLTTPGTVAGTSAAGLMLFSETGMPVQIATNGSATPVVDVSAGGVITLYGSAPGTAGAGEVRVGGGQINAAGAITTAARVRADDIRIGDGSTYDGYLTYGGGYFQLSAVTNHGLQFKANNSVALTIAATGAATFGGSITAGYVAVVGTTGAFNVANKFGADHFSGQARLYSNGPDVSTNGGFDFNSVRSDGSNQITALSISSTSVSTFYGTTTPGTAGANEVRIGAGQINAASDIETATKFRVNGSDQPVSTMSLINVNASSTADLLTVGDGEMWCLAIGNATDGYMVHAVFGKPSVSSDAVMVTNNNTNANLTVALVGNILRISNGIGATRTMIYTLTKLR